MRKLTRKPEPYGQIIPKKSKNTQAKPSGFCLKVSALSVYLKCNLRQSELFPRLASIIRLPILVILGREGLRVQRELPGLLRLLDLLIIPSLFPPY